MPKHEEISGGVLAGFLVFGLTVWVSSTW